MEKKAVVEVKVVSVRVDHKVGEKEDLVDLD